MPTSAACLSTPRMASWHTLITARGMVPPLYHKVLEVSLDTRAFAPAVEAQRQVAEAALRQVDGRCTEQFENGDAWAVISWPGVAPDVDGHPVPVCTASDLEAALEHAKPVQDFSLDMSEEVTTRITRHDHVFPSRTSLRSSQSAPTVFVYGLLGTTSFKKFHGALERLREADRACPRRPNSWCRCLSTCSTALHCWARAAHRGVTKRDRDEESERRTVPAHQL